MVEALNSLHLRRFHISYCYPSPGVDLNPIALGDRWLAYADQRLISIIRQVMLILLSKGHFTDSVIYAFFSRSFGGLETDCSQSMAAWGINVGSRLAQGVSKIYSNLFSSSPTSPRSSTHQFGMPQSSAGSRGVGGGDVIGGPGPQKGVVTILDVLRIPNADGNELLLADRIEGVIAHFIAHNKVSWLGEHGNGLR